GHRSVHGLQRWSGPGRAGRRPRLHGHQQFSHRPVPEVRMRQRERGGATIFVLSMSVILMLCAGLVIDGGMGINARMRVADDAEQAARAGANAVDITQLRAGGALVIDPGLARLYAQDFLQARGYGTSQFSVAVTADSVQVEVRD